VQQLNLLSGGQTRCWLLSDGRGPSIVDFLFADVDPDELAAAMASESEAPDGPYNCLLVRGQDALVLVDTGLGGPSIRSGARAVGFGGSSRALVSIRQTLIWSSSRTGISITSEA